MTDPTPPAACLPGLRGGVVPCQSMSARRGVQRALGKEGASFLGLGRESVCAGGGVSHSIGEEAREREKWALLAFEESRRAKGPGRRVDTDRQEGPR